MKTYSWLDDARWDIRLAGRVFQRHRIATATAILSVAIGIGANTAIFTVANALFFRAPAGVVQPERLVDIGATFKKIGFSATSYPIYLDVRRRTTMLDSVYAHPRFPHAMSLEVDASGSERVFGQYVTTNYFAVLAAVPAAGRLFGTGDSEQPGASPIVVLSHRFWQRRFGGAASVVGRAVRLNQQAFTIVGVAPEGFQGTGVTATDAWVPLTMIARTVAPTSPLTARQGAWLLIGGRLTPAATVAQAAAELEAIGRSLDADFPDPAGPHGLSLVASSRLPGSTTLVAAFVGLLMGIVAIVLVVACANLAGMQLARAMARRKEIAVRLALGASRTRLVRQLLTETALLFVCGGALGLLLADLITTAVAPFLPSLPMPISVTLGLDARALALTIGLMLMAALLSGLAPALQSSRDEVTTALRDQSPGSSPRSRLRDAFVVAQVSLSLVLVIVGGLFAQALRQAGTIDPGFEARGVETATLDLGMAGYTEVTGPRFWRDLRERIRQLPSVQAVTLARVLPGGFESIGLGGVSVPGVTPPNGQTLFSPDWNIVEPGYFDTLRLPLLAGRDFAASDAADSPLVAIVGEGFARQVWPGEDALGKSFVKELFIPGRGASGTQTFTVVGVARDIKTSSLVDGLAGSFIYVPLQQNYANYMTATMTIAARTADGRRIADEIRAVVAAMNPALPIVSAQTLEEASALGLTPQRIAASTAGSLGLVGLLLATIGIYGVTAHAVACRTREFGIRIALGARSETVMRMVLAQAARLAGLGVAIGLLAAAGVSQLVAGFLFGVRFLDPLVFGGSALLFISVALVACYGPARKATAADPLVALRHD